MPRRCSPQDSWSASAIRWGSRATRSSRSGRRARRRHCSTRPTRASCRSPITRRGSPSCSTRSPRTARRSTDHAPIAVGHRVVHGGARFFEPTLITPLGRDQHRRAVGARAAAQPGEPRRASSPRSEAFPDVPHVAVFDTAFHQTLPPRGLHLRDRRRARGRRTASAATDSTARRHKFVSEAAAAFVGRPARASSSRSSSTSATARRSPRSTAAARSRRRWG